MAVTKKNAIFWDVHCVALVRTDISEDLIASITGVTKFGELGIMLSVTRNQNIISQKTAFFNVFYVHHRYKNQFSNKLHLKSLPSLEAL
jgi:hypothetical protein